MQHSIPEMKTKLLTMDSWTITSDAQDKIALLKTIRNICHKKDGGANATTIFDLVRMNKEMTLSTKPRPNPYRATYRSTRAPLTSSN